MTHNPRVSRLGRALLSTVGIGLLLLPALTAVAQDAAPSLADALRKARPLQTGVALTVDGGKATRLPDAVLSGVQPTVAEVADAYGQITQTFGGVTAVAPPTMTVLNTDTTPADPYDGIPPADAMKLLSGSLDDGQWGLLTGKTGLGVDDLSETQRPLFEALFSGFGLSYRFYYSNDFAALLNTPWNRLGQDDLQKMRLRLTQRLHISVPVGNGNSISFSTSIMMGTEEKFPQGLVTQDMLPKPKETLQGVTLRAVIPNAPKPSDLDFNNSLFAVAVSLDGVKTVGDLVARIGAATHLELYADRRYESRTVLTLGATSASAGDLLRALALCVRGAYRQVDTACVLTNDRVGLAPRRLAADLLAAGAVAQRQAAEEAASDRLITQRGGILDLSGAQGEGVTAQEQAFTPPDKPKAIPSPEYPEISVPWSLMTPPQQEMAETQFKLVDKSVRQPTRSPNWIHEGKQNGLFTLSADVALQLLSPGFPAPLELPNSFTDHLFRPSPALQQEWFRQNKSAAARFSKVPPAVSVAALAARIAVLPRRAVFARLRTAADLGAVLGAMKRLGLNQLWLDVFSQGKAHADGQHDLLAEALAKTKGTGIAIVPTIELLDWGPDAPADARDLNIFGETPPLPGGGLPVSPAQPSAEDILTALVRRLAATPGVSAIAIHDTVSIEQQPDPNTSVMIFEGGRSQLFGNREVTGQDFWSHDLGYVTPLRLGFLRRRHLDPLDLPKLPDASLRVEVSVPDFDDRQVLGGMDQAWNDWRMGATMALMQRLLVAAQASAGRQLPFLVHQPVVGTDLDSYCLWDDPHTWLPLPRPRQNRGGDDSAPPPPRPLAHLKLFGLRPRETQTREAIVDETGEVVHDSEWGGIVLDFGASPGGKALADLAPQPAPHKASGR